MEWLNGNHLVTLGDREDSKNRTIMSKNEPISSIMTSQVVSITPDSSLHEADRIFSQRKFRHIPVVRGDELVGMLSLTDLLRLSFADQFSEETEAPVDTAVYNMLTVSQIMMAAPVVVEADQTIAEVAKTFSTREFHALPVVKGSELVGIVTTTDLMRYLVEHC